MEWWRIDKLIDLHEEKSWLWDVFDREYQKGKGEVKEKGIATIAEEFEIQSSDMKTKSNAIRDQFGWELKSMKSRKSGQSTDKLYTSQWISWDQLQFLQTLMKTSKSRDTLISC